MVTKTKNLRVQKQMNGTEFKSRTVNLYIMPTGRQRCVSHKTINLALVQTAEATGRGADRTCVAHGFSRQTAILSHHT